MCYSVPVHGGSPPAVVSEPSMVLAVLRGPWEEQETLPKEMVGQGLLELEREK